MPLTAGWVRKWVSENMPYKFLHMWFLILGSHVYNCLCKWHWLKFLIFRPPPALHERPSWWWLQGTCGSPSKSALRWLLVRIETSCKNGSFSLTFFLDQLRRYWNDHEWVALHNGICTNRKNSTSSCSSRGRYARRSSNFWSIVTFRHAMSRFNGTIIGCASQGRAIYEH